MKIIDRKTARAKGLTRYFTGKPHPNYSRLARYDATGLLWYEQLVVRRPNK
jgi:hypothetical protein